MEKEHDYSGTILSIGVLMGLFVGFLVGLYFGIMHCPVHHTIEITTPKK